jgi:hypothetical protein
MGIVQNRVYLGHGKGSWEEMGGGEGDEKRRGEKRRGEERRGEERRGEERREEKRREEKRREEKRREEKRREEDVEGVGLGEGSRRERAESR